MPPLLFLLPLPLVFRSFLRAAAAFLAAAASAIDFLPDSAGALSQSRRASTFCALVPLVGRSHVVSRALISLPSIFATDGCFLVASSSSMPENSRRLRLIFVFSPGRLKQMRCSALSSSPPAFSLSIFSLTFSMSPSFAPEPGLTTNSAFSLTSVGTNVSTALVSRFSRVDMMLRCE